MLCLVVMLLFCIICLLITYLHFKSHCVDEAGLASSPHFLLHLFRKIVFGYEWHGIFLWDSCPSGHPTNSVTTPKETQSTDPSHALTYVHPPLRYWWKGHCYLFICCAYLTTLKKLLKLRHISHSYHKNNFGVLLYSLLTVLLTVESESHSPWHFMWRETSLVKQLIMVGYNVSVWIDNS